MGQPPAGNPNYRRNVQLPTQGRRPVYDPGRQTQRHRRRHVPTMAAAPRTTTPPPGQDTTDKADAYGDPAVFAENVLLFDSMYLQKRQGDNATR